ncbi:MAG: FAD-dependent oxidoreductase [Cyanobacteria bacterium P01_C01_bin.118]
MVTIAIVGAGMAGLTCGRILQTAGHQVVWFEKSRGVGGRLATRRLEAGSWVDHGLRYWAPQGSDLMVLTQELLNQRILRVWSAQGFLWEQGLWERDFQVYCAEPGVNAIAKHLAQHCDIRRQHRVTALVNSGHDWTLTLDTPDGHRQFSAEIVVLAIPAPQVWSLLQPLDQAAADTVKAVEYEPCLSLMANYERLPLAEPLEHRRGWHITARDDVLSWLSLDSSKPKEQPGVHALLLQSQPEFAAVYFAKLDAAEPTAKLAAADQMLAAAKAIIPGLNLPQTYRLHGWRYSAVRQSYQAAYLMTRWPNLLSCGDWCSIDEQTNLDAAYRSGRSAAEKLLEKLD